MRDGRSTYRLLAAAWLALAILLAAFGAAAFHVNQAYRVQWNAAAVKERQRDAMDQQAVAAAWKALRCLESIHRVPLKEVERLLNDGQPLQRDPIHLVRWVDPVSGGEVVMSASDDTPPLVEAWPRTDRKATYSNLNVGVYGGFHFGRRLACIAGYIGWGVLLFAILPAFGGMDRPQRLLWTNVFLMVAAASTSLSLIGGTYWRAWKYLFLDDAAGVGFLQVGVSLILLLVAFLAGRREADPTPRCRTCRYNLTGNLSGRCPECGTPVAASLSTGTAIE